MVQKFEKITRAKIEYLVDMFSSVDYSQKYKSLTNTCVCTIVRDELRNPAGGIIDFVESTAPYVGALVVLDTLSVDGTWLALKVLAERHKNLFLGRFPFEGYASARNRSIVMGKNTGLEYFFALDADERLTSNDFIKLREVTDKGKDFCDVNFMHIDENGYDGAQSSRYSPLLKFCFNPFYKMHKGCSGESLDFDHEITAPELNLDVRIKHFQPSTEAYEIKSKTLYFPYPSKQILSLLIPPSKKLGFIEWKRLNKFRQGFSGLRILTEQELRLFEEF